MAICEFGEWGMGDESVCIFLCNAVQLGVVKLYFSGARLRRSTVNLYLKSFRYGCGSKNRYQNGTLVSGNMDQHLRNPSCLILSHTPM